METLKEYFEQQREDKKNKFNIFSALHNENDETRLHSRFIAYLLNPKEEDDLHGVHGFGDRFFKLFLNEILKVPFSHDKYEVKTEYKNIDIFIRNNNEDAIIIENKIYAGDSNHDTNSEESKEAGYVGQLERYYNTVTTEIDCKYNVIKVIYLTLNGHNPTKVSLGNVPPEKLMLIDYTSDINKWLDLCAQEVEVENELLSQIIIQYKELVTKLTSDVEKAKKNKDRISEEIEKAWELEKHEQFFSKEPIKSFFAHVKWHTVDSFFNELQNALLNDKSCKVTCSPDVENITKVVHNNSKSRTKLILKFTLNNTELQIVNDSKGFSLGNLTEQKWGPFSEQIKNIRFCDFSKEETFKIISTEKRKGIIEEMVKEIKEKYNNLERSF